MRKAYLNRCSDLYFLSRAMVETAANAFQPLALTLGHVARVAALPFHHRDPFDRLLVAQAIEEDLAIVSADPIFQSTASDGSGSLDCSLGRFRRSCWLPARSGCSHGCDASASPDMTRSSDHRRSLSLPSSSSGSTRSWPAYDRVSVTVLTRHRLCAGHGSENRGSVMNAVSVRLSRNALRSARS